MNFILAKNNLILSSSSMEAIDSSLSVLANARVAYVWSMTCGRRSCIAGSRGQCPTVRIDFFGQRMFLIRRNSQQLAQRARHRTTNSEIKEEISFIDSWSTNIFTLTNYNWLFELTFQISRQLENNQTTLMEKYSNLNIANENDYSFRAVTRTPYIRTKFSPILARFFGRHIVDI